MYIFVYTCLCKKEQQSWGDWSNTLGTYIYNFGAQNVFDSAFCWGLAIDDEFKRDLYASEMGGDDYSAFNDIEPDPASTEGVNYIKFQDIWKS